MKIFKDGIPFIVIEWITVRGVPERPLIDRQIDPRFLQEMPQGGKGEADYFYQAPIILGD